MPTDPAPSVANVILDVVIELLEERGYDGWTLQDVPERAHASMTTIYKHFPSRDDLIVAAIERWMEANIYRPIHEPAKTETLFEALAVIFRTIFEPWEQHPIMLQVFVRASATSNGQDRLLAQGQLALEPVRAAFSELDSAWVDDVNMILTNVVEGALYRYFKGQIPITAILENLERTLSRLDQVALNSVPTGKRVAPSRR